MRLEPRLSRAAQALLTDPAVLRCAWEKTRDWYRREFVPEPEYSEWILQPTRKLRELGVDLASRAYKPGSFPLVPYPKKGGQIRHYAIPPVRDQVAFLALGTLLAPLLEIRMKAFSFGNRWYRRLASRPSPNSGHPTLTPQLFTLADTALSRSYAGSYGLFRRSAHWTAERMLQAATRQQEIPGHLPESPAVAEGALDKLTEQDFDESLLPYRRVAFVSPENARTRERVVYHARLDVALAYPSVKRRRLRAELRALLLREPEFLPAEIAFPPGSPWMELHRNPGLALELADLWMDILDCVSFEPGAIGLAWLPPQRGPKEGAANPPAPGPERILEEAAQSTSQFGLPTGLAVSGLLFNVYMARLDDAVAEALLVPDRSQHRGAAFRFVDDIVVLASGKDHLCELLDCIVRVLGTPLDAPESGLFVSWAKAQPKPLDEILSQIAGIAAAGKDETIGFRRGLEGCDEALREEFWRASRISRDNLNGFVTDTVETLSDLATETIDDFLGDRADSRLSTLHRLVRQEVDDREVRRDTVLSFATWRLAKTPLPFWDLVGKATSEKGSKQVLSAHLARELDEIRKSIAHALEQAPWKTGLWLAVLRAGLRVVQPGAPKGRKRAGDLAEAKRWLLSRVRLIAQDGPMEREWPGAPPGSSASSAQRARNALAASWLRACFWRALASTIRDLGRIDHARSRNANDAVGEALAEDGGDQWGPGHWAYFLIPEDRIPDVAALARDLGAFLKAMYPAGIGASAPMHWWERQSLAECVLALHKTGDVLDALGPGGSYPQASAWPCLPRELTKGLPQAVFAAVGGSRPGGCSLLALLRLCSRGSVDDLGGQKLWRILSDMPPWWRLGAFERLGVLDGLSVSAWTNHLAEAGSAETIQREVGKKWLIWEYDAFRRRCLKYESTPGLLWDLARRFSAQIQPLEEGLDVFRLLWGAHSSRPDVWPDWTAKPTLVPMEGLPAGIVMMMLRDVLGRPGSRKTPAFSWSLVSPASEFLTRSRWRQLGGKSRADTLRVRPPLAKPSSMASVPPHAVMLRSANFADSDARSLWSNAMLALTALTGGERILDSIFRHLPGPVPFSDWHVQRSGAPAPRALWQALERVTGLRKDQPVKELLEELRGLLDRSFLPEDDPHKQAEIEALFEHSCVDASLGLGELWETPLSLLRQRAWPEEKVLLEEESAKADGTSLSDELRVRMVQVRRHPDWARLIHRWPRLPQLDAMRLLVQLVVALPPPNSLGERERPELLLAPEVSFPAHAQFTRLLQGCARKHRLAIAIGRCWRALPTVYSSCLKTGPRIRYFVNEAVLVVPIQYQEQSRTSAVQTFYVRKPIPTYAEYALAEVLSTRSGETWRVLPGTRWHRFLHPRWGGFSVAICSDILDPEPWATMRGQVLHIFLLSYNKDVELYLATTWARAYENYSNLVAVNHGQYGGSLAWTPRAAHAKKVAILEGADLRVVVDVTVPVKEIFERRTNGGGAAVKAEIAEWEKELSKGGHPAGVKRTASKRVRVDEESAKWKSPPPVPPWWDPWRNEGGPKPPESTEDEFAGT